MGNAVVAMGGAHSFFYNPAGICQGTQNQLGASYYAPLGLSRLGTVGLHGIAKLKGFYLGAGLDHFGDKLYQENKAGLVIARQIDRVALGLKLSYLNASVETISSRSTPVAEFGVIANVHPQVSIGLHAFNITGAKLFLSQSIPSILRVGASFMPIKPVTVNGELERIFDAYYTFKAGLEYRVRPFLPIRVGINSRLKTNHFGFGYTTKQWQLDIALHTHTSLGVSNHLTLSKSFGDEK